MSKPTWDESPEWASFVGMDGNGAWYWYEHRPTWAVESSRWMVNSGRFISHEMFLQENCLDGNGTLEPRP